MQRPAGIAPMPEQGIASSSWFSVGRTNLISLADIFYGGIRYSAAGMSAAAGLAIADFFKFIKISRTAYSFQAVMRLLCLC